MLAQRTATKIEVGAYEDKVGIRLTMADGSAEVFVFEEATAASLFHQGLAVVEQLRQVRAAQDAHPTSFAALADYAQVRLVK